LSGRSLGEGRRRLGVQPTQVSFGCALRSVFVTETTIREANNNASGNHFVAGLGLQVAPATVTYLETISQVSGTPLNLSPVPLEIGGTGHAIGCLLFFECLAN